MLYLIGAGPGDPELISVKALRALERCNTLAGWRGVVERLIKAYPQLTAKRILYLTYQNQEGILAEIGELSAKEDVCVVAHGDPAVSDWEFVERIKRNARKVEVINGVSSLNVALVRLGLDLAHVVFLSQHASNPQDIFAAAPCLRDRALVVFPRPTRDGPTEVARALTSMGLARCKAWVLQDLTTDREEIWSGTVGDLAREKRDFSQLSIVVADCREAP
ncbi:MAG: precorrin-6y C5,15-methyltransferase (decarboxylating) subunit CbiE [Thermoproteus sp.]